MVKSCLGELRSKEGGDEGIVIELSGVVHRDDNLALKEIIRGLHLEEGLEGDRITGSFSENLLFLLQSLNSGQKELTRPIIFILDQFELFCSHRNQTLLYNLFDIAQSAQAPICVIGLTTR
jgi:origin recognition complex subunit 4